MILRPLTIGDIRIKTYTPLGGNYQEGNQIKIESNLNINSSSSDSVVNLRSGFTIKYRILNKM